MTENELQQSVVTAIRQVFGNKVWIIAHLEGIPLGSCANKFVIINHMKNMGMVKGNPDLAVLLENKTVYFELKTDTGVQTKEQLEFENFCKANGHVYRVCRSVDCVLKTLQELGL